MNELSDKIWITRKTRIYTEKRLLLNEKLSQILMIWYSLFLAFFSIWSYTNKNSSIDLFILFASITVLVSSVFLYSQRFAERALQIRQCYIKLDELYYRSKRAEEIMDMQLVEKIHNEYSNVLVNVENHIDFDHLCFRYSKRNDKALKPSFSWSERVYYYIGTSWRHLLRVFWFIIPLIPLWFFFFI